MSSRGNNRFYTAGTPRALGGALLAALLTISLPLGAGTAHASAPDVAIPSTALLEGKQNKNGVKSSSYEGKYYRAKQENKRECIVGRESSGRYDAINPTGSYRGAYQMSAALARGVTYMMAAEHKKILGKKEAKKTLKKLREKPINKWPRYWQDAAFFTIANWDYTGSGLRHWAGGRYSC